MDYFSKFDWENYSISLPGPVRVSSLSEIEGESSYAFLSLYIFDLRYSAVFVLSAAETLENGGGDLLLTEDFYRYCVDTFSVPSKVGDFNSRTFPQKHLNIVDPLKEYNNLGRSVSKGRSYSSFLTHSSLVVQILDCAFWTNYSSLLFVAI